MTTDRDFTTADLARAGETSAPPEPDERRTRNRDEHDQATGSTEDAGAKIGDDPALPGGSTDRPAASDNPETDDAAAPLFPAAAVGKFRDQWVAVQGQFVDEPRQAVEQADHLVAELMQRLAAQFSETRADLERRWDGQDNVSTEELRIAMTQYRAFFERLLHA